MSEVPRKLFFDNSIQAAWMLTEHGVKLETPAGQELFYDSRGFYTKYTHGKQKVPVDYRGTEFIVNSEMCQFFDVRADDLVKGSITIQRNDKHFFMPKQRG